VPHPDEPALVAYVAEHTSATALAVYDATDPSAAADALRAAAAQIWQIRHPIERGDGLPNRCDVSYEEGVPVLYLDMKDEVAYAALVVRIVLDQLADAGIDGRLEPKRHKEFRYDPHADLFSGMDTLTELDERGLPPGFPDGFPIPLEASLVLAQRVRDGVAEHAAWRRSDGPFTGYLDRLRAYGCTFGEVPRLLTVGGVPHMSRYTLWRDGAGGSVTLYQSHVSAVPVYWYVSVVWHPEAEPVATTVEPTEAPDTRAVPAGPPAARELAEFLVPAELVPGFEAVMALATAGRALDRLVNAPADDADRRAKPVVIASRLAPALGRLDPEQLGPLRHACFTMFANLIAAGRRPRPAGLSLVPDENGHLYAANLRERAQGVVGQDLLAPFETGLTLVQVGPIVTDEVSSIRTQPVRPPVARYAWLFAGLDPDQLIATRDACWRILGV
jgi:hypothetical protein